MVRRSAVMQMLLGMARGDRVFWALPGTPTAGTPRNGTPRNGTPRNGTPRKGGGTPRNGEARGVSDLLRCVDMKQFTEVTQVVLQAGANATAVPKGGM